MPEIAGYRFDDSVVPIELFTCLKTSGQYFIGFVVLLFVASPHAPHWPKLHSGLFTAIRFMGKSKNIVGWVV
jgi:hypothetical protein